MFSPSAKNRRKSNSTKAGSLPENTPDSFIDLQSQRDKTDRENFSF